MMRTASVLVVMGMLAGATPGVAQEVDDLTGLLDTLAVLWTRGDAAALASHSVETGLDLEVGGQSMGSLHGRRAAAALRQLFGIQETVTVEAGTAATVVGAEDRAFGEFTWVVKMPGAAMTERNKIFVALVREQGEWRISQIRIFQ